VLKSSIFIKLIFTKKDKKRVIIVCFKLFLAFFYQKKRKSVFFRMLKNRVFWKRSLFLVKTAKKRKMNFLKKRLKQVKNA
tara:strand:+ start:1296 stop:1535 length:240 start_codon:yes stop_codon:yes gene_type:complete